MPATRSARSTRSREIVARAHEVGALAYVDAVAYAPHGPIDVQALDADFLVCSRVQVVRAPPRRAVRQGRGPRRVARVQGAARPTTGSRPAPPSSSRSPARWRRPTTCATSGDSSVTWPVRPAPAVRASGGENSSPGWSRSSSYERELVDAADRRAGVHRRGHDPRDHRPVAGRRACADRGGLDRRRTIPGCGRRGSVGAGIYVWDGDFYATGLIERLGKAATGGVLRLGLVHYNTAAEVDRTLEAVESIATAAVV